MGNYLFFLLILACPLMMMFMMRGHRGHGSSGDHGHMASHDPSDSTAPVDELRRQRAKLDEEMEARVADEARVGGRR